MTAPIANSVLLQSVDSAGITDPVSVRGVLGGPLRRSIGSSGDHTVVVIRKSDWPVGWDVNNKITITINPDGGVDEKLIAKGYRIKNRVAGQFGVPFGTDDPAEAHQYQLLLETEIRTMRDSRGGLITETTYNELDENGLVDTEASDYQTVRDLVNTALDAIGMDKVYATAAINETIDGQTVIAPGPIDWGNARSVSELDSLLTRVGWTMVQKLNGKLAVVRLHRAGQPLAIPQPTLDKAEPFELASSPGIRGTKILVTSGATRTTMVTSRSLGSTNPLVWLQFDERTNAWLTQLDYDILYPDEAGPEDIAAYQAGLTSDKLTPNAAKGLAQQFRAVGLTFDDFQKSNALVNIPSEITAGDLLDFAGSPGVIEARCCVDIGSEQLQNVPAGDADDPVRIDGLQAVTGDGVFILPSVAEYVRVDGLAMGRKSDTRLLSGDDLTITFAYESNTGDFETDYFVRGYEAVEDEGELVIRDMTEAETTAAISDPDTIKMNLPQLRRVMLWAEGDPDPTPLNDTALEDIAREHAASRIAWGEAESGVIPLRGLVTINPGDLDGSVTAVTWDQQSHMTYLEIDAHEVPRSETERERRAIGDSIAAGLGPVYLNRSSVALGDARSSMTVDQTLLTPNPGNPESNPQLRGKGRATSGQKDLASSGHRPAGLAKIREQTTILAVITGSATIAPQRFEYDWEEARFDISSGTWVSDSAGRTSTTHGKALNLAEANNSSSGIQGNGVDLTTLTNGFSLQPVRGEPVVELRGPFDADGTARWWFSSTNAIDGECAAS